MIPFGIRMQVTLHLQLHNPALKRDRPQAAGPLALRWAS